MGRSRRRALEVAVLATAAEWTRLVDAARSEADGVGFVALADAKGKVLNASRALSEAYPGPIDGEPVSNGVSTSNRAANAAFPIQGSVRREIIAELHFIHSRVPTLIGRTIDELEVELRRSHATVSAAVNHLVGACWIEDSGFERDTRSKRGAIVWQLTQRALDELDDR